ncbi:MAG: DHHW family protein [Lawsonibacter sp.]|jgi:hypothetical protein
MTPRYSKFITVLFCAFIAGVLLISTLLPDIEFSELENRVLQSPPKLTLETLQNGKFMTQAEDYVSDHIVGRDFWVALKAWSERLSGKRENNGIYFGKDNTLISRVEEPDMEKLNKDLGALDALVSNSQVPVYFGLIPTAATIWEDKLPTGAPTADERAVIDQLYFSTGANTIDLVTPLDEHKEEDLYYRTDHHWTSLGAYYGANALLQAMGLEPLCLSDYTKTTVTDQFYGTLFSSSGVRWLPPDHIDTYVSDQGISVTSYPNGSPVETPLYDESYLEKKDKYSYFLGGVQGLRVIETQLEEAPKLLLIRDSYSDSLAPFLTQRFSQIHLFDLRYNATSIQNYIEEHDIDAVVVLYSFSNFISDKNLGLLAR